MSDYINPFKYPEYKAWIEKLSREGARVATAVVLADGRKMTMGNVELGRDTFQEMIKIKRKDSTDWIPEATELKKLPKPLGEIYKNQNKVKTAASYVLKFFLEKEVKFGHGENFMWDFEVPVDRLKYSSQGALNSWKKANVKMSDFIEWCDFTIPSFAFKPKNMKINIREKF